ncbi:MULTISPECIES: geranylgeranyl reductase [unclassified Thermosynechococcus]|uniref:geranylgeranyl reductase n=1 Tax=unclassified Thermosynechococcus TaxID=2622553 RepID=UPI00197D1DD9|nr:MULTISPECIES: geranylgeranyl reductase [unclassified Thermosynechococcus]MDR7896990.1 geranylgeranyl reductase [Thermosynechococcus sp. JY1332]MDR7904387.1 geranylgeranyl reductase [Thermosynechococcus sp. JY1334]QSF49486.1 geranylgeranyl reductase [Thermosynechococcus sp. TA-1]WKT81506.1 geranylgeranyl reductase [Thermosynechococcus sp. PP45]WKT86633.1 geranylgeranyl reductase [Thermosynechococcus sp. JY1339]
MSLRVAVVGGGPAGSSAAETLAKAGIQTYLFERKLDNAKPCGGAIPLCMVSEFDLPPEIIDRRVRKMKMISPSNIEVNIGHTLKDHEYIGMCRREVLDSFMRNRAADLGANLINGTVFKLEQPATSDQPYTLHYVQEDGTAQTLEVDVVIGADGANSRIAKEIDAGDYNYAIAYQERIRLPEDKMTYYNELAEMYVGDDVSPDFYAWVFPKYDHVAVGTGTMKINKDRIRELQAGIRARAAAKLEGGQIIKVEAHPIPEHPRPRRVVGRVALVGDAAGTVTKSSGEGIYFAAKSARMCAETIVETSNSGRRIPTEADLKLYLKRWDKAYGMTYLVLDLLQRVFYRSDATREAFVEMCSDIDVQKLTFDSYLYKTVVPANPLVQLKITAKTIGSLMRGNALAP